MRSRWTALSFAAVLFITASVTAHAGPLHDAVKDGDIAGLRDLIAAGEDLEAQDKFVGTELNWAALMVRQMCQACFGRGCPARGGRFF